MKSLLETVGWKASSILDLGSISSARGTEALIAVVAFLVKTQGFKPFALSAIYSASPRADRVAVWTSCLAR